MTRRASKASTSKVSKSPTIRTPMKRPRGDGGVAQSPAKRPRQQEDKNKNKIIFFKPSGAGQASTSKVTSPKSPDGFSGWTEEETAFAALNASLTT